MNSELLTREGVTIFIIIPFVLLLGVIWQVYKQRAYNKYFFPALVIFLLGFAIGGENTAYRYPAEKISDQNFSLFYSKDLEYKVISDNKRWDNVQGNILVSKRRNAWGAVVSESVVIVPTIK